jgi:hypothetical protein
MAPRGERPDPVLRANASRNGQATAARAARWRGARDALWALLDRHVAPGAVVAVVGAGNGHDVPLRRLARRAARVDLHDIDAATVRSTAGRVGSRRSVRPVVTDVTLGAASAVVRGATGDGEPGPELDAVRRAALPGGPYDLVVADLLLTQLLYPALVDAGLPNATILRSLRAHGQDLTDAVATRLHRAAPDGLVVWVHDVLGWWDGHEQPFTIDAVLDAAREDPEAALRLAATGRTPRGADPRRGLERAGATVVETAFWRWPFARGTDYLVCATVARSGPDPAATPTPGAAIPGSASADG